MNRPRRWGSSRGSGLSDASSALNCSHADRSGAAHFATPLLQLPRACAGAQADVVDAPAHTVSIGEVGALTGTVEGGASDGLQ